MLCYVIIIWGNRIGVAYCYYYISGVLSRGGSGEMVWREWDGVHATCACGGGGGGGNMDVLVWLCTDVYLVV